VIQAHGYTPFTRILSLRTEAAGDEIAAGLNIAPTDEALVVEKLFLADEQPVILAYNRIPLSLIKESYQPDDFRAPVYEFLWRYGRQHLTYYLSEIVPIIAGDALAQTLRIPRQTPLISFSEIGYNADNEPILHASSCFRDDLLRLRLIRRQVP